MVIFFSFWSEKAYILVLSRPHHRDTVWFLYVFSFFHYCYNLYLPFLQYHMEERISDFHSHPSAEITGRRHGRRTVKLVQRPIWWRTASTAINISFYFNIFNVEICFNSVFPQKSSGNVYLPNHSQGYKYTFFYYTSTVNWPCNTAKFCRR